MTTLSVAIISYNEEDRIGRCIEGVQAIADEIIIVDSHSSDNTPSVAEAMGAKVFTENWQGFVEQKNFALSKCTGEWILNLDCDEVVTPPLSKSIRGAIDTNTHPRYRLRRKSVYLGKTLDHSWQPDLQTRLVRADASPRWTGEYVHERLISEGSCGVLEGFLLHYSYRDLQDHFHRLIRYSRLSAKSMQHRGRRFSLSKWLLHPPFAFCKKLILKRGILDGYHGVLVAASSALAVFLKYAFLWEMRQNMRSGNEHPEHTGQPGS
jgi:glycosyltransferase involved in cell wall biosynthesis